jgi:5-methylcytosine-specific restriction endonuclease McrA
MNDVLLLNQDYSPLKITSLKRGFKLVFKGKAEVLYYDELKPIITDVKNYVRPTIIRLLRYISLPYRKIPLTRDNIYLRDGYKCIYCETKKSLTLDHVIPRSKGGNNEWDNLITCCHSCNVLKGDKSVEEFLNLTGYKMRHKPYKPNYLQFLSIMNDGMKEEWIPYLKK